MLKILQMKIASNEGGRLDLKIVRFIGKGLNLTPGKMHQNLGMEFTFLWLGEFWGDDQNCPFASVHDQVRCDFNIGESGQQVSLGNTEFEVFFFQLVNKF